MQNGQWLVLLRGFAFLAFCILHYAFAFPICSRISDTIPEAAGVR